MDISFKDSTIQNLTINQFNSGAYDTGPLTETITIPCSKQFKELVAQRLNPKGVGSTDLLSNRGGKLTGQDIEELGRRYFLEGDPIKEKEVIT